MLNEVCQYISAIDYMYWVQLVYKLFMLCKLCFETILYNLIDTIIRTIYTLTTTTLSLLLSNSMKLFKNEFMQLGFSESFHKDLIKSIVKYYVDNEPSIEYYNSLFCMTVSNGYLLYLCYKSSKDFLITMKQIIRGE